VGGVTAYTVTVKPRVDGQLISVTFHEGGLVQAGEVLASIDPRPYQFRLAQAEGQLSRDQAELADAIRAENSIPNQQAKTQDGRVAQLKGTVKADQANVDSAKLELSYAQVTAPITGVVGLRLLDPGNVVHAADAAGIVVINQLQPISVVFEIPEDRIPQLQARLRGGARLSAEVWDRNLTAKIATGRLAAVDNQIDPTTGTVKLKAVFDNKDGRLFPGQFVNVRLLEISK
jgi:multidrug efflux system membrane fusion protein